MKKNYLPLFEYVTLQTILRLKDQAYAMELVRQLSVVFNKNMSHGQVVTTLKRMVNKGLLTCEERQQPRGRSIIVYTLTPTAQTITERTKQILSGLLLLLVAIHRT